MSEHDTKVKANHIEIEESCMKDYEEQSKTWKYKLTRIFDIVNTCLLYTSPSPRD